MLKVKGIWLHLVLFHKGRRSELSGSLLQASCQTVLCAAEPHTHPGLLKAIGTSPIFYVFILLRLLKFLP